MIWPRSGRLLAALCMAGALAGSPASAQKYGGVLRLTASTVPIDLSVHESAITSTVASLATVYNNVVVFDVFQRQETLDTIVPDLAQSWRWSADGTELTFKLRQAVKWHDGKPFTGRDVKHTFDVVRGASEQRPKLNPRKLWYSNVKEIVVNGDHEVTFKLGRRQPSLLAMLAGGYSPVHAAHTTPTQWRATAMGTGPFRFQQYVTEQRIEVVRNPHYFVQGRPYLDGAVFYVIRGASTQNAALISGQVDVGTVNTVSKPLYEQLKAADPTLVFNERVSNATINLIINANKPPFDKPKVRQAVSLAMNRYALIQSVYQGGAVPGGALIPSPHGQWGLTEEQLKPLPGFGDPARNKAEARRLLAEAGYGPANPLRFKVTTRNEAQYPPVASWAIGELKQVGIAAELQTIETGVWYGMVARREVQMGINATAIGVDDPDATFYETYKCYSQRNYSSYCNPELEKRFDAQSSEPDQAKRKRMVNEIDVQLQLDLARPYLAYRKFYYPHRPYVKNWIPHQSIYNGWRLQEVWLDK
ncbi:MAG: ABC transporter substrate-binding protein [Candidatus Lambdaproteobacteria bacterium]|nr:ABC transporter substrate-binding protein [Candidatus Lambdaproteobacteria bacterium]